MPVLAFYWPSEKSAPGRNLEGAVDTCMLTFGVECCSVRCKPDRSGEGIWPQLGFFDV